MLSFRVNALDAQRIISGLGRGYGFAVRPKDLLNLKDHAFYRRKWEGGRYWNLATMRPWHL